MENLPWFTASEPQIIGAGKHFTSPAVLTVDPGTGNVQVQFKNSEDAWTTPEDEAYTIAAFGAYEIPRANVSATRILATGDAVFTLAIRS